MLRITNAAIKQLRTLSKKDLGIVGFQLSLKLGGCNGFNYKLEPLEEITEGSGSILLIDNELSLQLCNKSELYLLGTEIDWTTDIMGDRFTFNNPLSQASCGCGSSFTPQNIYDSTFTSRFT